MRAKAGSRAAASAPGRPDGLGGADSPAFQAAGEVVVECWPLLDLTCAVQNESGLSNTWASALRAQFQAGGCTGSKWQATKLCCAAATWRRGWGWLNCLARFECATHLASAPLKTGAPNSAASQWISRSRTIWSSIVDWRRARRARCIERPLVGRGKWAHRGGWVKEPPHPSVVRRLPCGAFGPIFSVAILKS